VTQGQLAAWLQITQASVSYLETYRRGAYMKPVVLVRLLEITGLPVAALDHPEQFVKEHPDFLQTCKAPPSATS
jgi:hypothetical protein